MIYRKTAKYSTILATAIWLCVFLPFGDNAVGGESISAPEMPTHWKVVSDYQAPARQVDVISGKLGADLVGVRNTVYDVDGKRVQINVIVAIDSENAEKLLTSLKSMKSEEALLRKGTTVYEFVGPNEVLPLIAEGRRHLDSM